MTTVLINDCRDANALGRQKARAATLLEAPTTFIGVSSDAEAAGNLIDALDALDGQSGTVLVNVAPRNGEAKKWENGTPFGYFWYNDVLVVASVDGYTLSLVKKLELTDSIKLLDISTSLEEAHTPKDIRDRASSSQFRSFDFLPRIARILHDHRDITSAQEYFLGEHVPDIDPIVWWIDNFGNCKTTLLLQEINQEEGAETRFGHLPHFAHLKDVPNSATCLVTGSSGLGEYRFLEIVQQGGSASEHLSLASGETIF